VLEFAIPTMPGLRAAYMWYFNRVLPKIGNLISRHNAAYRYLPASVSAFASPDEFVTILRQCGFSGVRAVPLTFGIVYLYTAQR
jgi:demethylmenaquinone methyltransferase/2-methoxy-6-polyprenyl-1,4-benzoquinol methylase